MVEKGGFKTETPVPRTPLGVVRNTWLQGLYQWGLGGCPTAEAGFDFDLPDADGRSRLTQLES